mgnify:CR=1 FL=1
MKENIIQAIVADLQRDLDCRQMARLKAVLHKELQDVEITETPKCQEQSEKRNAELLDSFLSAKKIEGCSEKTLAYYRHTIERMLLTVLLPYAMFQQPTSDNTCLLIRRKMAVVK